MSWTPEDQERRRQRYANDPEYAERMREANRKWRSENGVGRGYYKKRRESALVFREKAKWGCCWSCGYDEYLGSLDWHHVGPKRWTSAQMRDLPDEDVLSELAVCVLVCKNCHYEIHGGVRTPPERPSEAREAQVSGAAAGPTEGGVQAT